LVVDEVLAVGDAEFQRKCVGKMEDVSRSGRTILFVSHNMGAVRNLCRTCLLLDRGSLRLFSEDVAQVISTYLIADKEANSSRWEADGSRFANPYFSPRSLEILDAAGNPIVGNLDASSDYWVCIEGDVAETHSALTVGYALYTDDGTLLYWSYHTDAGDGARAPLHKGRNRLRSRLPRWALNEGTYRLELIAGLHFIEWLFEPNTDVPTLYLELTGLPSQSPYWFSRRPGILAPCLEWINE
jgi:lipopolysaccharide transport system ATP-binding protein